MPAGRLDGVRAPERARELGAFVHAPLDEDGQKSDRGLPGLASALLSEPVAVGHGARVELHRAVVEESAGKPKSLHHAEEELGVRRAARQSPRLLLVKVLGERKADVRQRRDLAEDAGEEYRKVTYVHCVLVLKVRE
jgi:hypothetical protein